MELHQIAEDVYACLQPDRGLGWSNSGFVSSGGGLVVDTFWDLPRTRQLIDRYRSVSPAAPRRLVNTHHNGDHCWGNQLFAGLGTEIIGHRLCAEHMGGDAGPEFLQGLVEAEEVPPNLEGFRDALREFDFRGIELTPPSVIIEDELEVDLDGVAARVIYVGPSHTAGDVLVHLPDEGVVFAGDILFHRCTPIGWEGTTANWVAALDLIERLEPAVVVPGHGPLADLTGVREARAYLLYVHEEARRHFDAGRSVLEASKGIDLGPYAGWTEPERLVFNVARAYREFSGGAWDTPLDVTAVLADMAELRSSWRR